MNIDKYDIQMLTVLQTEGRISIRQLADRIHLSPSPCWVRMRKLEEKGYIAGYHADIDYQRISKCFFISTFISLENQRSIDFERFETSVLQIPELIECELVSGDWNYILKFLVTSVEHYQKLYEKLLESDIGISKCCSYFRSKQVKKKLNPLTDIYNFN